VPTCQVQTQPALAGQLSASRLGLDGAVDIFNAACDDDSTQGRPYLHKAPASVVGSAQELEGARSDGHQSISIVPRTINVDRSLTTFPLAAVLFLHYRWILSVVARCHGAPYRPARLALKSKFGLTQPSGD
jgi:hypothetical protein